MTKTIKALMLGVAVAVTPAQADVFYWSQSDKVTSKPIGSVATDHCVLLGIGGKFMGTGERAGIWHDANYWYLGGTSAQADVHAYAYCFPRAKITSSAPDAVRWSSDDLRLNKGGGGCHNATKQAWRGDAITAISRVSGGLRGFGEQAEIQQASNPALPSLIVTTTCKGNLDLTAHSLFVGRPGTGSRPRMAFGLDQLGNGTGTEFTAENNGTTVMASSDTTFCYLTKLSGTFNGGGEEVRISAGNSDRRWRLSVRHASGQGVKAAARCYAFEQL